jgi:hypothetical protein
MEIKYKIDTPNNFSEQEKKKFLELLKKQGQVINPNLNNIKSSSYLCIVQVDEIVIGIGALKNVYKKPFKLANVNDIKDDFEIELGYIFVDSDQKKTNFRGIGIGKNITQFLLSKVADRNVFATTELNQSNPMFQILRNIGFESIGNPYKGMKTGKIITLMILIRNASVASLNKHL